MMKRLIKKTLKFAWRGTSPIRRPFVRRFEAWIDRYVVITAHEATENANLALDFAAAEIARMNSQVDRLCASVESRRTEALLAVDQTWNHKVRT